MDRRKLWDRYRTWLVDLPELGFRLDVSRMDMTDAFMRSMAPRMEQAFREMEALEAGAIANPDENRMVGHYWLRDPDRAPTAEIRDQIRTTAAAVEAFAGKVREGVLRPEKSDRFRHFLLIGIGGSALGPQLVADALGGEGDLLQPHFLDNTDPDGFDRVLGRLRDVLDETLVLVISKSGGTPETRNGMLETRAAYEDAGLSFGAHAVAVTQEGSLLDAYARDHGFLARFPMWDWVGGRTSVWSAVGLVPARLQGLDAGALLQGAAAMDAHTRVWEVPGNPAALLALAWYFATDGRGRKDMVVLPYKDRLALFSRYLQQLVMESLGKERDRDGQVVHQGITVYGNKGSTDQHAYVQQLREGVPNFFVTFIQVLRDRRGPGMEVEPQAASGDFLHGFLLGTREALYENHRGSLTVTLPDVDPRSLGMLIALYERAVGFYASLVNVNAYHQPGVEAGKKAAAHVLQVQRRILDELRRRGRDGGTCEEIAAAASLDDEVETVFHVLEHLAANPERGVVRTPGATPFDAVYRLAEGSTS